MSFTIYLITTLITGTTDYSSHHTLQIVMSRLTVSNCI